MSPVPYNLKPKNTRLPAGHDKTLDPPEPPTDSEIRGLAPMTWAPIDLSRGGLAPPDAPLAPPGVDPAERTVPAFEWERAPSEAVPNRSIRESCELVGALDPDIELWPQIKVNIWPFTGAPTEGIWPVGWLGVDDTGTPYVCIVAGEPGTWTTLSTGSAGWPSQNGTGAGNLQAETATDDTVGYIFNCRGSGPVAIDQRGTGPLDITTEPDSAGINITNKSTSTALTLTDTGGQGVQIAGAKIGFYGQTPVDQQTVAGFTTVAEVVSFLQLIGLGA